MNKKEQEAVTMDAAIARVERLGFQFSNWLSNGSAVCIKSRRGSHHYAQIDVEDPSLINGESFDAFKQFAKEAR